MEATKQKLTMKRLREEWGSITTQMHPRLVFWLGIAGLLPDFTLSTLRAALYRKAGCRLGAQNALLGSIRLIGGIDRANLLTSGTGCLFATGITLGLDASITLGCNVSVGPNVTLHTATHSMGFGSRRMSPAVVAKPIVIEDGAWVGMHAVILPGVTIGQGAVVSAGSVVTQDVPANTLVIGNPATVQQKLPFGNR